MRLLMAHLLVSLVVSLLLMKEAKGGPPSPGYYPSSSIAPTSFYHGFRTLWGPQHQTLQNNILTLWLDHSSGSGFKSLSPYRSGYFSAAIKLQPGYTAGVITSFYLSNQEDYPGHHDEIDIEFLGTIPGKPYTLQTNVYVRGSGDGGNIVGREIKYHLWFDPTQDFHNYAILWTPAEILFLVDDVPIRRYPRKSDATFPVRPMWAYGSIWDASSWATEAGKYKADYRYQPFVGRYRNFKVHGCPVSGPSGCRPATASPQGSSGLSGQQQAAMNWVHSNYLVYDYCRDPKRNHALTPECYM